MIRRGTIPERRGDKALGMDLTATALPSLVLATTGPAVDFRRHSDRGPLG